MALLAGLLVPGWCLLSLLDLKGLSPVLALPASAGIGLSIVSVAAWLAWLSGTGMKGAVVLAVLASAAAVVGWIVRRTRAAPHSHALARERPPPQPSPLRGEGGLERPSPQPSPKGDRLFEWGAAALAAVATGISVAVGPWLGQSADTFYHMAAALRLLQENRAIPQDIFFGVTMQYPDATSGTLQLALAWLSLVGGIVPAWVALSIVGSALLMLSFTTFAREVTRSTLAALIAGLVYILVGLYLDMRDMGYPDRIGQALGWLSLVFLLRFARASWLPRHAPHPNPPAEGGRPPSGRRAWRSQLPAHPPAFGWKERWRELVPMCLLGFAAGSVYPGMTPLLVLVAMATLGTGVLVALRARNPRSLIPLAIACGALLIVVLPVLAIRLLAALPPYGVEASHATIAPRLRVIVLLGYPFIDPRSFWFGGITSIVTVGTLCLLGRARRLLLDGDPGAALLWGGVLFVPAVMLTPLLAGSTNSIYALARLAFLLSPLLYVSLGWGLASALELVRTTRVRMVTPRTVVPLVAGLLLVAATTRLMASGFLIGPVPIYLGHGGRAISTSRQLELSLAWVDRLNALEAAGPGTILAGEETSYELAGLTGRDVVSVPRGHTSYQDEARDAALRRGDTTDALKPSANPSALLSVLFRYRVTFVMADQARDGKATWDWLAGQKELITVAQGSGWRLYRFDSSRIDQALDIPLFGGTGVFPSRVIAGRAVFVRIKSLGQGGQAHVTAQGLTSGASYQAQFAFPAQVGATITAPLLLPDAAPVDRYSITVSVPGSLPILAGQFEVGHAYEAEYFAGVFITYRAGYARNPGWNSVVNPSYSHGLAAIALRAESVASYALAEIPADYCLSLFVYDAGDGRAYTLDVGLGGNVARATWSGPSRGLRDLELAARVGSASHQITYWVPTGARVGAIVDRITLYPPALDGACTAGAST